MTLSAKRIVSYGELLWDLFPGRRTLGGAPANFAYRSQTLGNRTTLITRLGTDPFGHEARQCLAALGMDQTCVQSDSKLPTGTVEVTLDAQGGADYFIVPNAAYDCIILEQSLVDIAATADCFCFGTLVQRTARSRETLYELLRQVRGLRLLDLNLRKNCYSKETIESSLQNADVLKLNESEVLALCPLLGIQTSDHRKFVLEAFARWPLNFILITRGENGVFGAIRSGGEVSLPGYRISVRDTCGSGDAFTAGFIHAHLQGESFSSACRLGNALGALVATQSGATEPLLPEEINALLNNDHKGLQLSDPS